MAQRLALLIALLCASCVSYVPQDFMSASATKSAAPRLGSMAPIQFAGDLSGDYSTQKVTGLQSRPVSSGAVSTGNTLGWSGAAWAPSALNLGGGANYVTGTLPTSNQASQTLGGDLSGTTASGLVRLASTASHVDLGGTVAQSGSIRAANNTTVVAARGSANTQDIPLLTVDSGDNLVIGSSAGTNPLAAVYIAFAGINAVGISGTVISTNLPLALSGGSFEASAGLLRLPNTGAINWRNAANTGNVLGISSNGSNQLSFGGGEVVLDMNATTAPFLQSYASAVSLAIGTGAPAATLNMQAGDARTFISATANGPGTAVITVSGSTAYTTRSITGNLTIDTTTKDKTVIVDTSSGVISVTLPTPTNGREIELIDKKSTWGTNNLTLVRSASEKIDNVAASRVFSTSGARCKVWSDGTDWYTGC